MNTIDMQELLPLEEIDVSLYSDAKCNEHLDHWHNRMQDIKQQYPDRADIPKEAHCELSCIVRSMERLYREMNYRDNRWN